MHMITFTIKLYQLTLKISAHLIKGLVQKFHVFVFQTSSAVFCYKHQMHMHIKCTMPTMSKVLIKFHKPSMMTA